MGGGMAGTCTFRTPEKVDQVLRELRSCGDASAAVRKARVARRTWYSWLDADPELATAHKEAMTAGREARADRAEDRLGDRIEAGDTTAIIFALKTLRREVYGDRATLNVNLTTIDRTHAEQLAAQYGLDVNEVIAEAERHLAATRQGG
jgi:hypothetical protein